MQVPGFAPTSVRVSKYFMATLAAWTLLLAASFLWDVYHIKEDTLKVVKSEADGYYNKDMAVRYWAASHGGVYVPLDSTTAPNPYLAHIPERDVTTSSGLRLTLMNPAYVIREISQKYAALYGVLGHITSLKPLNPENLPDEWERKALLEFEKGKGEVTGVTEVGGRPYFRLMRSLKAEQDCLKCHAYQGYLEGDVRGGFSIAVPLWPLYALERETLASHGLANLAILFVGYLGLYLGGLGLSRAIARGESAEQAVVKSERLLRKITENYPNSYLSIIEKDMTVGFTSGQEFKKRGLDPGRYVGLRLEEVFGEHYPIVRENYLKAFKGQEVSFELYIDNQYQLYRVVPFQDQEGRTDQLLAVAENITEQRLAEEALRASEARLREAQNVANIGCWELDIVNNRLTWSEEIYCIFEKDPGEFGLSYEAFLDMVHPADREAVDRAYSDSLLKKEPYEIVHRIPLPDGRTKYVQEKCKTFYDEAGRPRKSLGTVQDITDKWRAEQQSRESEEKYRALFDSSHMGIALVDAEGRLGECNRTFSALLGYGQGELQGRTFASISHGDELVENVRLYGEMLRGRRKSYSLEKKYMHKDGHPVWASISVFGVYDALGKYKYGFAMVQDISERKLQEVALRKSLEEKVVLLAEVHHRVKNNMQVISSLLSLQSQYIDHPASLEQNKDMRSRIRSMALAHEMLYRSRDFSRIDLRQYVESLVRSVAALHTPGSSSVKTSLRVEDLLLEMDILLPCGLILNELLTNSYRHAFRDRAEGALEIVLARRAEGLGGMVGLEYRDNGRGLPEGFSLEGSSGLGLRLVQALVGQIDGTMEYGREGGAVFRISFPERLELSSRRADG